MIMRFCKNIFLAFFVCLILGCATSANYTGMMVTPSPAVQENPKLKGKVSIGIIGGGKETNPLWTSQVDNFGFKKALEASLASYGYLATSPENAVYRIDANLLDLSQPLLGLDLNVKSSVYYKVTYSGVTKQYSLLANGVATFSDAVLAYERLRIANEKAIQENIKQFMKELGILDR